MMISVFDRVENSVGKGEKMLVPAFFLFHQCFQKASFSGSVKVGLCVNCFCISQLSRFILMRWKGPDRVENIVRNRENVEKPGV